MSAVKKSIDTKRGKRAATGKPGARKKGSGPCDVSVSPEINEAAVPKLAHEFRTRLAIIKGSIDNVADGIFGKLNSEQGKSLLIASEGVERMRELVEDLMASFATGHDRIRLNREIVDIMEKIEHAVESMQSIAYKEGIKLTVSLPKNLPPVYCDPVRIEQVLLNFLRNSMKFTSRGGLVNVSAADFGDSVEVSVSDNGVGIPEEKLANLFDQQQADKFRTKNGGYRTSGLGLLIVKDILDAHGSHVSVKSKIGKGTVFKFALPTAR